MRTILNVSHVGLRASIFAILVLTLARGAWGQITQVQWNGSPELLNPSLTGEWYEYAPSAMVDPNDPTQTDIWTCHNSTAGVISDHIYYSQAVNGQVVSEKAVMGPSASGWDSLSTCDPSVAGSTVTYQGTQYQYVLFYLGNDCGVNHNQIGMAFANSVDGTWTKFGTAPVIKYSAPNQCSQSGDWGVGQPSVTSIDGAGKFLVFYSAGTGESATIAGSVPLTSGCEAFVSEVDYNSSTNTATIAWSGALPTAGLPSGCGLHNFDVMYDPATDHFYAVGQDSTPETYYPQFVSDHLNVFSISGGSIWGLSGTWSNLGSITSAYTGFARNHDAGLLRKAGGTMPDPKQITVIATEGCASTSTDPNGPSTGPCNNNFADPESYLATYRLYSVTGMQATGGSAGSFALGSSPNSQTIKANSTATYTITVYPSGGFSNAVNLTASGLPSGATAVFSPSSVTPGTDTPVNATLTVQLPSSSARAKDVFAPGLAPVALGLLALPLLLRRKRWVRFMTMLLMIGTLCGSMMLTSCSGGTTTKIGGGASSTQPANYTIYVTGTSGSQLQTTTLSLTVTQ